ncbi:hypothetical protein [Paenibacillus sp. HB172176]|uniref:hypothetical protein n=1 Tax=Paenibacillus sp. HB172176 TaxID=2493690 RepID=UPI00143A26A0|nr:hypothetical protein [Paenibacillus sp. HB172176]
MLGTWRWNAAFGLLGIGLTVLFSYSDNPWSVIMIRALYACATFFVLGYAARGALGIILKPPALIGEIEDEQEDKGGQLDLSTPDESEDLNAMLKEQLQGANANGEPGKDGKSEGFKPLSPPQLVSTSNNKQPEELAKALRHLTGE